MRLAALLRPRRLLMQVDPALGRESLKRPYARNAAAQAIDASTSPDRAPRPAKSAKLDDDVDMPPSSSSRRGSGPRAARSSQQQPASSSSSSRRSRRGGSGRGGGGGGGGNGAPVELEGLLRDVKYIEGMKSAPLKPVHAENPKSPLANYCSLALGTLPDYQAEEGYVGAKKVWRVTVRVDCGAEVIVGEGDSPSRKDAEKLAALSACIQLNNMGVLENPNKVAKKSNGGGGGGGSSGTSGVTKLLSDGTPVDYEKARQFMDWYCRRFGFPKEDVSWENVGTGRRGKQDEWEAVMTVGGRRIGIGAANNKKAATIACYLDVTQYLESCDAELWKTFMAAAKSGKDLGLAPRVHFQMSDRLDDDVRDLCHEIKQSTLYKNRPKKTTSLDPATTGGGSTNRARVPAPEQYLIDKSERLKQRRADYAADPAHERMRTTRAGLPVFSRAEDVIRHIDENEVTICMAATGSGKTTQIPQLVLDDWIAAGKGARCNIVCTQPRRLAAISVADRVAKERGEVIGRGSVGYQVRFEAKLPEEHGSITFCTIGIFLKRMQSALLEGGASGGANLDDVTHVVVDEVHERDVDTDLLLVVLKRLLEDRKARGKPIKVVLMSATIDPTLFQQYFPDVNGAPAKVIEIPGRAFPVERHFLDEYIGELATRPAARAVLADRDVAKYLQAELEPGALRAIGLHPDADARALDEDSPVPAPLVAMAIAHVLKKSDQGHVLVFLPGWDDIQSVNRFLLEQGNALGHHFGNSDEFSIHMLHSSIPLAEQQVIFDPPKDGVRRVILSTNIAETSVTIPDVVYVVDTGKVKEQRYDPDRHMSSLVSAWVGSSNLNQRAGRAGRHRPGEYYGVLTRARAERLHPYQMVEMKRVDLSNVVMHVKALNFPSMSVEDVLAATIEPPAAARVGAAMQDLRMVGALDAANELTALGRVLLQLPIEAQMGRMVLFGSFFRCLDHALTLAAIMTNRDPFVSPMHLKEQAAARKNSWVPPDYRSDVLATLHAYDEWWRMQSRGEYGRANAFCSENFLAKPTLLTIQKIKGHLLQALRHAGVLDISGGGDVYQPPGRRRDEAVPPELNRNADSLPLLTALITIASQPNFGIRTGNVYRTQQDKQVFIHPSSVNHRKRDEEATTLAEKQIMAFAEKRQNVSTGASADKAQKFIVTTTRLDPVAYILFGAYNITVTERGLECDEWLPIVGNIDALDDIQRLKYLMEACMLRVFEGITFQRHRQRSRRDMVPLAREDEREDESDDDDDGAVLRDYSLAPAEVRDLDAMTTDIVRVLNNAADERIASQSRHNSRPGSPASSPMFGSSRLPAGNGGGNARSGTSTPFGAFSAFNSRPGTPGPGPSPLRKW